MTKKEKMELLVSKVPEEQREAFVAELRDAGTKEARGDLFKKYRIKLTKEETERLKETSASQLTDEELDQAAGGCCNCHSCYCSIPCG